MIHPVRRLDRWIDSHDGDDLPHAVRLASADRLRRLAGSLWTKARLDEARYLSEVDFVVARVVGYIDATANRLDPPW